MKFQPMIQVEITDGRIFELICQSNSVRAYYQDSWGKLFNTKKYRKAMKHIGIVNDRINNLVKELAIKEIGSFEGFILDHLGSTDILCVQKKRKQRFRLRIFY